MIATTCRHCGLDAGTPATRCVRCNEPLTCPYCRQPYHEADETGSGHCFGAHLVVRGLVTPEQLALAVARQRSRVEPIGQIGMRVGMLTLQQVFLVLNEQRTRPRLFGELAVELGFIDRRQLVDLVAQQRASLPSLIPILVSLGAIDEQTADAEQRSFAERRSFAAPR